MFVGRLVVNAQRARITSNVIALSAVYGGIEQATASAQLNNVSLCGFEIVNETIVVCSDVEGVQRWAKAADSWMQTLPTLEE